MNALIGYTLADPDFYAPLESSTARGALYRPSRVPEPWRCTESGVWTMWGRDGLGLPAEGWKVHVSARADRLAPVLDTVADICFERGVPFKHLSAWLFYHWTHQKHASRSQGGKFIAAYPADVDGGRELMKLLADALRDEVGPFILSDRRFPGSSVVHYRYGGFARVARLAPEGTSTLMVRDGNGEQVEDERKASFRLPPGIEDPFISGAHRPAAPRAAGKPSIFNGFEFIEAIRHSNAGGTYRAREIAGGRSVFVKEARAHVGVEQDGRDARDWLHSEWETLRALHEAAPGLAPEPIAYFDAWEHDFMVTEFVPGTILRKWMVANSPLVLVDKTPDDFAAYYARCEKVLAGVERALDRLHVCGYLFMDVSPDNILVDDDDEVRLIDFETAQLRDRASALIATVGYTPPSELVGDDPDIHDAYGLAGIAQLLLAPMHHVVQRNPDALSHLHHDLSQVAPMPPALWKRATTYHAPVGSGPLPSPEQVDEDPISHLTALRELVGDALVAMADTEHPDRIFPTVPEGYNANTSCVAYGAAGVVHALHQAGRPLPGGVLERLCKESLATADELPPGFHVGTAGIAWVLAEQGLLGEASRLLDAADRHPLTRQSSTLLGGKAGVALSHLAMHRHTGDGRHLDRAAALASEIPAGDALTEQLGKNDATGLLHGRTGIALVLQQLAAVTGESAYLDRGLRLLHAELDRECDPDAPAMAFPVSSVDRRQMPYLYCGSAGVVHVATRYLRLADDERLSAAMPRLLKQIRIPYTVMPGLYQGHSGLGLVLAERALLTGDPLDREAAVRLGRALFKFAIPHETGVRFLGDKALRISADLWSGSAGILLFLTQLLDPRPDPLFTVAAHVARTSG